MSHRWDTSTRTIDETNPKAATNGGADGPPNIARSRIASTGPSWWNLERPLAAAVARKPASRRRCAWRSNKASAAPGHVSTWARRPTDQPEPL